MRLIAAGVAFSDRPATPAALVEEILRGTPRALPISVEETLLALSRARSELRTPGLAGADPAAPASW